MVTIITQKKPHTELRIPFVRKQSSCVRSQRKNKVVGRSLKGTQPKRAGESDEITSHRRGRSPVFVLKVSYLIVTPYEKTLRGMLRMCLMDT